MRAGTYRPYWYDAAVKAKAKVSVALATAAEASAGTVDTKPLVAADLINAIAERKAAKAA
ncbi:hypothetical protein D3C78_1987770 [compost metagenome]